MYRNGNKNVGVPRRNEHLKLKERQEKNMIKDNMEKVINDNSQAIKIKRKYDNLEKKKEQIDLHRNFGQVPKYVNKYNKQREEM